MKKKICFIVPLPASAKWFFLDHMHALSSDYEVHLCANFTSEEDYKPFEGIICHNCKLERRISLLADLRSIFALNSLFKKESFASVHSMSAKIGLLAALSSKMAGVEHRIHIFTGQVWATQKGIKRWVFKLMDKIIVSLDTNLLADGFSQRQFLIDEGVVNEANSSVLAKGSIAGVNTKRFNPLEDVRLRERKRFGLTDEKIVFIFLGRLKKEKGMDELFEAFNELAVECKNAVLLLYGADEENYDKRAGNYLNLERGRNYIYAGYTSCPEESLQVGDVFCLPTYREGFGSSVIEASCLGLPVITSDVYGVVDASVENVTGLRCRVADTDGLLQCMKYYYDHPKLIKEHGINGRERVLRDFDNAVVSKAWVDYYHKVVGVDERKD